MAKKSKAAGKSLVIVESPAKARTISKFLGSGYTIEASIGHIRDLPQGAKEIPQQFKGEDWAYLGVNVNADFEPVYVVPKDKVQQVRKLKAAVKDAKDLYLATDEDREGEAISWHLCQVLKPKVPVRRLVFHEITAEAIREALAEPREINDDLVRAQEVRRIVDRLYGYDVSPLLWRKIKPKLSAGRVQSVAVRLIVERERQRMAFVAATFWDLVGTFVAGGDANFEATLVSVDGRKIPTSRDFDPATGKLKNADLLLLDEKQAEALVRRLTDAECRVGSVEDKPYTTRPYAPFTTSTLQQEANRKYGFTARRTMQIAQSLYENGHITYMRTDSTNLATVAVNAARELVAAEYGKEYLADKPRTYQTKVKNAQEAHEAIRPAGHPFEFPAAMRAVLSADEFKLFDLIWKRTVASQMADARGHRITITVEADGAAFVRSGKTIEFPGYLRAYVEGSDDPEAELADRDDVLPAVTAGEVLACSRLDPKSHTTQPPTRYSDVPGGSYVTALHQSERCTVRLYVAPSEPTTTLDEVIRTRHAQFAGFFKVDSLSQVIGRVMQEEISEVDGYPALQWQAITRPLAMEEGKRSRVMFMWSATARSDYVYECVAMVMVPENLLPEEQREYDALLQDVAFIMQSFRIR